MDRVKVGVIGCGRMASELARRCVGLGKARITAVADPNREAAERAAAELGAAIDPDADALCARADVKAVIVATPPAYHLDNVLIAAAAGKHVYCEKPLGVTVLECDRMIAACREAGVKLFVGQVLRLFPLFAKSIDLIRDGVIGKPRALSIARLGYSPKFSAGWIAKKEIAGGLLLEINAHEFDYMRAVLGEPVDVYAKLESILGRTDYEDQGFVVVTFASGATAMLHTSLSSPTGEYRVHIQGTGGSMVHGGFGGTLRYQTLTDEKGEFQPEDIDQPNPYDIELASWLTSITTGSPPLFTGEDGRWPVVMAEAAYRSAALGGPVRIDSLSN